MRKHCCIIIHLVSFYILSVDIEVRLINQNPDTPGAQYSGLLEIFHDGQWGTVCNTSWTFQNSLVVCKLLGYPSVEHFYTSGINYPGNGEFLCYISIIIMYVVIKV